MTGNKGFSFIEIILVMGIIAAISTMGFYTFSKMNNGRDLSESYLTLANDMNEAKSSAVAQIIPSNVSICSRSDIAGYSINVYSDHYVTDILCSDLDGGQIAQEVSRVTFSSGMVMTTDVPTIPPILGGPTIRRILFQTNGTSTTSGQVCLTKNGASKALDINTNGVISQSAECNL